MVSVAYWKVLLAVSICTSYFHQTQQKNIGAKRALQQGSNAPSTKLIDDLFQNYNSLVEPNIGATNVTIGLSLLTVAYDADTEILTTRAWQRLYWNDPRLTWKSSDYGDVSVIRLPSYYVWTPDIVLYNSYMSSDVEDTLVLIDSSGDIFWVSPVSHYTVCLSDDHQSTLNCSLTLGSWTHDEGRISLTAEDEGIDTFRYYSRIRVISAKGNIHSVQYECCPEFYQDYTIVLKLQI